VNPSVGDQETPRILHGGLSTIAFLTAQLDEGNDYLSTFFPLVVDVINAELRNDSFIGDHVQQALLARHKIAMPPHTVGALLHRACHKGWLTRDYHRYNVTENFPRDSPVDAQKATINEQQRRLAIALVEFADKCGLRLDQQDSLDALLRFMEQEHVALVLDLAVAPKPAQRLKNTKTHLVIANFVSYVLTGDRGLEVYDALRRLLEGLVVYRAAFLPDLAQNPEKRFARIQLCFDTDLVFSIVGLNGPLEREYLALAVRVLRELGARCSVFEETLKEADGILAHYEAAQPSMILTTARGSSLERHLLTAHLEPGEIRFERAMLRKRLSDVGVSVLKMPRRKPQYVGDEAGLAAALVNPQKQDKDSPRIWHDVNCIAAVRTLRAGHNTNRIDDARALFVSSSTSVIETARKHYEDREEGCGTIPPMVHIRAITNIAWLKTPQPAKELKLLDAIALCCAALRPSEETWRKFTGHLRKLVQRQELTSNEAVAVVIASMTEQELINAEINGEDDARTYNQVVDAVKAQQTAHFQPQLEAARLETELVRRRAETLAQRLQEDYARRQHRLERISTRVASVVTNILFITAGSLLVAAGALGIVALAHFGNPFLTVGSTTAILAAIVTLVLHIHSLFVLRDRLAAAIARAGHEVLHNFFEGRDRTLTS
jgi:predicted transcriptional regulator